MLDLESEMARVVAESVAKISDLARRATLGMFEHSLGAPLRRGDGVESSCADGQSALLKCPY